jgi:hypothetical protein
VIFRLCYILARRPGLSSSFCNRPRLNQQQPLRTFWESQPGACAPDGEPCFIYSLMWSDYRIRSLHAAGDDFDLRSLNVVKEGSAAIDSAEEPFDFEFDGLESPDCWDDGD